MEQQIKIGYCTNVHAGVTLDEVKSNLEKYALPIKSSFSPDQAMGIGLWLSNIAARELVKTGVDDFRIWLDERNLTPFTFNAFPFSDFHQAIVKHNVYEPNWAEASRLQYTLNIAQIQAALLNESDYGSISTLPLGWPHDTSQEFFEACARNLKRCTVELIRLKEASGRHIFLALEPEPGCILDVSQDVVEFFSKFLLNGSDTENQKILEHIGVCHDVCHAAVMGESQSEAVKKYESIGIRIGKFQISSAIKADFTDKSPEQKQQLIQSLNGFAEDRYLHQTMIDTDQGQVLHEDLSIALRHFGENPSGTWTIHFHVPIFAPTIGQLETTRDSILQLIAALPDTSWPRHLEVETYAWSVMPETTKTSSLVDIVVKELEYLTSAICD